MNKIKLDPKIENSVNAFFSADGTGSGAALVMKETTFADTQRFCNTLPDNAFLDKFLAAIKWIFLYVPGVAAIHFLMMGLALSFFYKDWPSEMLLGSLGSVGFCTFMIMLGIGKLSHLRYLRVVGSVIATSALMGLLFIIITVLFRGDFFGPFMKVTLPFTVFVGYLVKRDADNIGCSTFE